MPMMISTSLRVGSFVTHETKHFIYFYIGNVFSCASVMTRLRFRSNCGSLIQIGLMGGTLRIYVAEDEQKVLLGC